MPESAPVKILIVDDDEGLLHLVRKTMEREGFETVTASLGQKALEWLAGNRADLMLLDLKLPDIRGQEFINHLASVGRSLPFIIITGQGDERVAVEMMKRGALDYLVKDGQFIAFLPSVVHRALGKMRTDRSLVAAQAALEERTAALREALDELQAFSYSISHDMRAPLRAMQSYAHFLVDEYSGKLDEQGVNFLQQIMRSSVRLDGLIRDALSYTKILQDRWPMDRVDLDTLVRDIAATYPDAQLVKPRIEITGTLPDVIGNAALLTQCVSKLLSNGTKFISTGTASHMEIWAEEREQSLIRVWFKDNGIGIAPENQARIFRMFERIYPNTVYEGMGIG